MASAAASGDSAPAVAARTGDNIVFGTFLTPTATQIEDVTQAKVAFVFTRLLFTYNSRSPIKYFFNCGAGWSCSLTCCPWGLCRICATAATVSVLVIWDAQSGRPWTMLAGVAGVAGVPGHIVYVSIRTIK